MGLVLFTERHKEEIAGVLSCYDRILVQGTLPGLCYADGMTAYLYARQIRIFDYPSWAQPLRDALRQNAERLAAENGLEIEFIRRTESGRGGSRTALRGPAKRDRCAPTSAGFRLPLLGATFCERSLAKV